MKKIESPRPAGHRIYVDSSDRGLRVPLREVPLQSPNPPVRLYDTSGPYGDPEYEVDLERGLPPLRRDWIEARGDAGSPARPDRRATARHATASRCSSLSP